VVHVEKDKKPEVFWYLIEADEKLNSTVYLAPCISGQFFFSFFEAPQIIIKPIEPRYSSLNPKTKPSTSRLRKITAVNFLILHKKIAYKRKHPGVSHKDLEL
jgi:hypothetical protein